MYLLRQSLFRDVFAACDKDDRCYIRNDGVLQLMLRFGWKLGICENRRLRVQSATVLYRTVVAILPSAFVYLQLFRKMLTLC
jgi:hypothetical protein